MENCSKIIKIQVDGKKNIIYESIQNIKETNK
jgi:hypothetical protein